MHARLTQGPGAGHDGIDRQAISCLIDGELGDADFKAAVDRLCTDPQARAEWSLLHAVGDALRSSEVAAMHSSAFAARVASAVEREPAIVAPTAARRRYQRVVLPGAAIAAAAALLAIVAVPQLRGSVDTQQVATSVPADAQPVVEITRVPELERYLRAHRELAGSGMVMPQATPYLRTSNNLPAESR